MKPKMSLDLKKDIDGYAMIHRAGSILAAHGFRKEAMEIHQEATTYGYRFNSVLKILKKYMEI